MKKFRKNRKSLKFEYEFEDGTVEKVEYLSPTTKQIDKSVSLDDSDSVLDRLDYTKDVLKECLKADAKVVDAIIEEQTNESNIYEFKVQLDEELGKLKKNA